MSTKYTTLSQLEKLATRTKAELDALDSAKQDVLVFNSTYNATSNKAATMKDVSDAISGLSGAMHFKGTSTQDPTTETVAGTQDGPAGITDYSTPVAGDVVTFGKKEFLYDGSAWREYGDEGDYAVKGSIKNSDIAADAAIEQSKIANLTDDLDDKADKPSSAVTGNVATFDANKNPVDSGKKPGGATMATGSDADSTGTILATEAAVKDAIDNQAVAVASVSGVGGSNGLMSAADKEKLDDIMTATDAEVDSMLTTVFGS